MLKPVRLPHEPEPEVPYGSDSPTVVCEACGKHGPSHLMLNIMIVCGSPGHPSITGFQCPAEQHWSCSRECWLQTAHACIDEHMHAIIKAHHERLGL